MDRLDLLAKLSSNSNTLLDIGCDHGYVMAKALRYYNVNNVIASELTEIQLNNAKKTLFSYNLHSRAKFVVSSGFDNINDTFDTVVIAGMGGILISSILNDGKEKLNGAKLILEPNKDQDIVRKTLSNLNYKIIDEYSIVDKNKYYEIIVATPGNQKLTDIEYKFGPILLAKKNKEFIEHYSFLANMITNILKSTTNSSILESKQKELNEIMEVLGDEQYELHK